MVTLPITEGAPLKSFEATLEAEMGKALSHFERELSKIRTGRAHTSMVEDIRVEAYGTTMPLKEVASLSAPEPQLLVVQPWDTAIIGEIERALSLSDLGVKPQKDGHLLRVIIPKLSGSRREELSKTVFKRLEECKVSVRNVRRDAHTSIRDMEKAKKISEDYGKRLQASLQKLTDVMIEKADQIAQRKEAEIKSL